MQFRNFISLDTRSREVRNKPQDVNKELQPLAQDVVGSQPPALNVVVRTYQSSVGQEYFISYEDELGYLYGFVRLLLPSPDQTVDFP
jgi:histone acetyltransferase (RNA polymerase elongator complex component)